MLAHAQQQDRPGRYGAARGMGMIVNAFRAEANACRRLPRALTRPASPFPARGRRGRPELLYHVWIAVGRVPGMLAGPEPAGGPLVSVDAEHGPPGKETLPGCIRRAARRSWLVEGARNPDTGCRCQGGRCR